MKTVFMGTPEFAVPSLQTLSNTDLLAVFCQPDRPKGRSGKPIPCPVKTAAQALDIPVFQPKRVRAKKWVHLLRELQPDLVVVAAFGQILSQAILDIPQLGCINVHASLLPRWRGASPIHHAILAGDRETGVGIMKMVLALDAGPVYKEARMTIPDSAGRVAMEQELAVLGARLLEEVMPQLPDLCPVEQPEEGTTYAPIIERSMGFIQFALQDAYQIVRMMRAFEGWPQVSANFRGQGIKIRSGTAHRQKHDAQPGTVLEVTKKTLRLACCNNTALEIKAVQPAGRKEQPVTAFINGYRIAVGEAFTDALMPQKNG